MTPTSSNTARARTASPVGALTTATATAARLHLVLALGSAGLFGSGLPAEAQAAPGAAAPAPVSLGTLFFSPAQRAAFDRARQGVVTDDKAVPAIRMDGSLKLSTAAPKYIVNGKEWDPAAAWPGGKALLPGQTVPSDGSSPARDLVEPGSVGRKVTRGPAELAASAPAQLQLLRSTTQAAGPGVATARARP